VKEPRALRVASVLPAHAQGALLEGCLASLRAQDRPIEDMIVVDDSPDGEVGEIEGTRVLRSGGRGPYAARNLGWRATDADVVLFLDARSRPRPDWARRLTDLFADPSVALAGSEVRIRGGSSIGARLSARHQFFELHKYVDDGFFRPYLPTCNLAARRVDLEAVGGFGEVRSGGDADFCWRVLDREGRRLTTVGEVLMEWVPRDRLRDYLEQNYRYGRSNWALRRDWAAAGAPQREPESYPRLARSFTGAAVRTTQAILARRGGEALDHIRRSAWTTFQVGYRRAADADRHGRKAS
jgi:cellulose synthase/poly-beta-1,6-N-acetylglucosamine synthase-like glycosyltransferase